jgi:hypothetical protein
MAQLCVDFIKNNKEYLGAVVVKVCIVKLSHLERQPFAWYGPSGVASAVGAHRPGRQLGLGGSYGS